MSWLHRLLLISALALLAAGPVLADGSKVVIPDLLEDELQEEQLVEELDFQVDEGPLVPDPLEPLNRFFFGFNDVLYDWLLKPVTDAYIWLIPRELRESAGNFFYNFASPVYFVNTLLQGDLEGSGLVLQRFVINSTLGVYGMVDVAATEFEIRPIRADFGQTLGKWGVGEGIYFCWPLLGPSNLRDSTGLLVDAYTHPVPYFHNNRKLDFFYYTGNRVNTLSLNPTLYDDLRKYSFDPYIATRQAYNAYRQALVERERAE